MFYVSIYLTLTQISLRVQIETFINCYRTGTFSKPKRIGVGELTPSVEKHYNNLVRLNDKTPSVCLNMQEDTAAAAA